MNATLWSAPAVSCDSGNCRRRNMLPPSSEVPSDRPQLIPTVLSCIMFPSYALSRWTDTCNYLGDKGTSRGCCETIYRLPTGWDVEYKEKAGVETKGSCYSHSTRASGPGVFLRQSGGSTALNASVERTRLHAWLVPPTFRRMQRAIISGGCESVLPNMRRMR